MEILDASRVAHQPAAKPACVQVTPTDAGGRDGLEDALAVAKSAYVQQFPTSRSHHLRALGAMPGGNTRSVLFHDPFPIVMAKGLGNRLWDCDGNEYIDFVGEFTAGLYGHSNPTLKQTILSTYENVGVSLGATTIQEARLAEMLCQRFHTIEHLRFCNSGTEANLYALSIARNVTGKRKVIAFRGGYHGGVLSFNHGVAKNNVDRDDWILGTYNDVEGVKNLVRDSSDVAAVIVEAMQGAGGCIPATLEFLGAVQESAKKHGVLFILDEVMTSRLDPGGLQGKYALEPDLTTLGKYIGGGLAFGAFGGREDLLAAYDPRLPSSLPHSGTFNNNTLAMSCGLAGLSGIYTPEVALELNALGDYFRVRLQQVSSGTKMVVTGIGAVLTIHFLDNGLPPVCEADVESYSVPGLKRLFWYWCLRNGFWITERGMLSLILGTTKDEIDSFVEVVFSFMNEYGYLMEV